jgi:HEAT repeat protein
MAEYTHAELAKLSPMTTQRAATFAAELAGHPVTERRRVARTLVQMAEENVELDYNDLYLRLLEDEDVEVRTYAAEGLWEDERASTAEALMRLAKEDPNEAVRSTAIKALGRFAYRFALGDLHERVGARVRALLFESVDPAMPLAIRRPAIEAVGYFPNDDAVGPIIREAYRSDNPALRASAVAAMGRTCDVTWINNILREMDSEDPEMRFEAAQAAGEIEDERALPLLVRLTGDEDAEVRLAAVASLGKIGGQLARETLRRIAGGDEEALAHAADLALEELDVGTDPLGVRVRDINPN